MDRTITAAATGSAAALDASKGGSAAAWGAIVAGAVVAIGVSLILVALGTGLGFASISPWPGRGVGAGTFTVAAAIWLIVMQWVSSLFGGYITGRLRNRWIGTHVHEVFFRDTANGLVTWALSTVVVAALVASSVSSGTAGMKAMSNVAAAGAVPDAERDYLAGLVVSRTGLSQADAQKRVDNLMASADDSVTDAAAKVKPAADTARKDAAEVGIYTALSLLVGAFIASVSAALGGRLRDEHV